MFTSIKPPLNPTTTEKQQPTLPSIPFNVSNSNAKSKITRTAKCTTPLYNHSSQTVSTVSLFKEELGVSHLKGLQNAIMKVLITLFKILQEEVVSPLWSAVLSTSEQENLSKKLHHRNWRNLHKLWIIFLMGSTPKYLMQRKKVSISLLRS